MNTKGIGRILPSGFLLICVGVVKAQEGPTIHVWYGDHQVFGSPGVAQQWVNILGNVSDADGVASLAYRLNGGDWQALSIGPDTRRLSEAGDFNADIALESLAIGENQITLLAIDTLANETSYSLVVDRVAGQSWPLPYSVNWSTVTNLQDVAIVVDGFWSLSGDGVRSVIPGYDRLVDIGDINWMDYEITVPITIHAIDSRGYNWPSVSPSCGLIARWQGHWDWGGWQPRIGYLPTGASFYYNFASTERLELQGDNGLCQQDSSGWQLQLGATYFFKMRVETIASGGTMYSAKVWADSENEPAGWLLAGMEEAGDLTCGSVLLVAHHVDATFGHITIAPITEPDIPVISEINLQPGPNAAGLSWSTDSYTTGYVRYGTDTRYTTGAITIDTLRQDYRVTLSNLVPDATYHYLIEATNISGGTSNSGDRTFVATGTFVPSTIQSDDFNTAGLDMNVWTFTNPLGDCTYQMPGNYCEIIAPAGVSHDLWTTGWYAPRIMQSTNDVDFEVETKFQLPVNQKYQLVGIFIEGQDHRVIRLGFHSDGANVWGYAASFTDNSPTVVVSTTINGNAPLYLQVRRTGHTWLMKHSFDGQFWVRTGEFDYTMVPQQIGPYVGNADDGSSSAPEHANLIDYFYNTATVGVSDPCAGTWPDTDGDGLNDCYDGCPEDEDKQTPGVCGCGVPEGQCDRVHVVAWYAHPTGSISTPMTLDHTVTDISTATIEARRTNPLTIEVAFDAPVTTTGTATVIDILGQSSWQVQQSVSEDQLHVYLQFAEGEPAAGSCCKVDLASVVDRLEGDADCLFRVLPGDVNGDAVVNLVDVALQKSKNRQPMTSETARFDLNGDGVLDLIDAAFVRRNVGQTCCQ